MNFAYVITYYLSEYGHLNHLFQGKYVQWPLLPTQVNFNLSMDNDWHSLQNVRKKKLLIHS